MGESTLHKEYINVIYYRTLKIIPENHSRLILMDGNENLLFKEVPPIIGGFRPDLFYEFDSIMVIGEAKTKNDYATKHSINQYKEYIKCCSMYNGESYLILCCPWTCTLDLKNIINKIKRDSKYKIKVIYMDEISGDK